VKHLFLAASVGLGVLWFGAPAYVQAAGPVPATAPDSKAWQAAWAPVVRAFGHGDAHRAVAELKRLLAALEVALGPVRTDRYTQAFVAAVNRRLRSFDLDAFYAALPERTPTWRWLAVGGQARGDHYWIGRIRSAAQGRIDWPTHALGTAGATAVLKSRPVTTGAARPNYLLRSELKVALARVGWPALIDGITAFWRYATAVATAPGAATGLVPAQAAVDPPAVYVLDRLAAAYPALAQLLRRLFMIEQLHVTAPPEREFVCLRSQIAVDIDALAAGNAALAAYLDRLDQFLTADVRWIDKHDRTLMRYAVRSGDPAGRFDFCLADGRLAPFDDARVYAAAAADPRGDDFDDSRLIMHAHAKVLGLRIDVRDLQIGIDYQPRGASMAATAGVTVTPNISFGGRALGIFSPRLINVLIPSNMTELANAFMQVAARGNNGRGTTLELAYHHADPNVPAVLTHRLGFEALNNFIVKFAARAGIRRVLPDADVRDGFRGLFNTMLHALRDDLARYAAVAPREP